MTALHRWHALIDARDYAGLDALLAEGAVFESPVVHTPQVGKAITAKYLQAAMTLLNNGTFRYLGEWTAERSAVLEFACDLDGIAVNGVDMIWWNEADQITRFKVMVRPLKAINMLHQKMGELLARA
ncbi:nuclear transport factor 2 family protein [Phenylobacterium aquaticum]|uniref:nuclear transport factor 2 family protein n=1 Tax=Phenylobacterium aquaticum TaxID=1763816 RepID=UPI001F5CD452|nr:nuclear transport factor 2 family protein [Phenylobacterium aquaticum]MCI3135029.1 nuclear transport factor 2 family protein [Phenylobacterium aquaticum]